MGTLWHRSGTIERYADDLKAAGAQAYFFLGGTTTPMTVYSDAAEGAAHAHPVVADANGRWPDIFIPYIVSYDVRVTTAADVQLTYTLEVPNPDPIDLTVTIPAENQVATGMIHSELVNTTKAGYVRLNGRTLGNAASSATERANADTSALFVHLWNSLTDAIAAVSGGRGVSAAADYAANKNIVLPDMRGRAFVGLDDMGNSTASAFTGLTFTAGDAITAGSTIGANSLTLLTANLPSHTHAGTTASSGTHTHTGATGTESVSHTHSGTTGTVSAGHDHSFSATSGAGSSHIHGVDVHQIGFSLGGTTGYGPAGGTPVTINSNAEAAHTHSVSGTTGLNIQDHTHSITTGDASATHTHSISSDGDHTHTFTTDATGSGTAINNLPLARLVTWYIKL